jgi:hypothetical protein
MEPAYGGFKVPWLGFHRTAVSNLKNESLRHPETGDYPMCEFID